MNKHYGLFIIVMVIFLVVIGSASAWGASSNVLAVDDEASCNSGYVCSPQMGVVVFADYSQTFTRVPASSLTDATVIGTNDTVFLYGVNPNNIPAGGKTALVNFVNGGGKLLIWDGEDPCPGSGCSASNPGSFDYTWLPVNFRFSTYAPGPYGYGGPAYPLFIIEENQLSTFAAGPFQINNYSLGINTDAVGDANIFAGYSAGHWCVDMVGTNYFQLQGPVHIYSKDFGSGELIYAGLDWDWAGDYAGYPSQNDGYGNELKKMLKNELNANSLPCGQSPGGTLEVEKTADKSTYNVGDTITFTITVNNPSSFTSYRTNIVDTPPAEVTCEQNEILVGDLAPGETSDPQQLECSATTASCTPIKNEVTVSGYSNSVGGVPIFTGFDDVAFTINGPNCNPISTPEFPTVALPVCMLLGMMFIIYSVRR